MYHVPSGALVVPSSLSDMNSVLSISGLTPVPASNLPALSTRARAGLTTVVFGTFEELSQAVKAWKNRPTVCVGSMELSTTIKVPTDAPLAFLRHGSAPEGVKPIVIGDVHNCHRTLRKLLAKLNVSPGLPSVDDPLLVFVGDLIDKGGSSLEDPLTTIDLVHSMVQSGQAVVVRGNHEQMLVRRFVGVSKEAESSQRSIEALKSLNDPDEMVRWMGSLPLVFRLPKVENFDVSVVHATGSAFAFEKGFKARRAAEQSCLFGKKSSKPLSGVSIHGHWEVPDVVCEMQDDRFLVNVDTGACIGNKLSAFDASTLPTPGLLPSFSVLTEDGDKNS